MVSDDGVPYDSRPDTWEHIHTVQGLMAQVTADLAERAHVHDQSKLVSPEVEVFDRVTPKLHGLTYGSDEYKASLAEMGEGLAHHYANNRHHPEHWVTDDPYPPPYQSMNLLDVIEMLADWKAATTRHADGDLGRSIEINANRFGMSDEFAGLLRRTARDLGWLCD